MRERLLDDKGELRRFVNIYLNGDDIRFLNQLNSKVKDGDDISIVPRSPADASSAELRVRSARAR